MDERRVVLPALSRPRRIMEYSIAWSISRNCAVGLDRNTVGYLLYSLHRDRGTLQGDTSLRLKLARP